MTRKYLLLLAASISAISASEQSAQSEQIYSYDNNDEEYDISANSESALYRLAYSYPKAEHTDNFIDILKYVREIPPSVHHYSEKAITSVDIDSAQTNYKTNTLSACGQKISFAEHKTVYSYENGKTVEFYTHSHSIIAIHLTADLTYISDDRGNLLVINNETKVVTEIHNLHMILKFIAKDDKLLAVSNNGSITCFIKDLGVVLWHLESSLHKDIMYNLNLHIDNDLIYTFSSAVTLSIIDLNSGNTLKTLYVPYNTFAGVYVDEKKIYCITTHAIYTLDKKTFQYLSTDKIQYKHKIEESESITVSPDCYTQIFNNSTDLFISTNRNIYKLDKENNTLITIFQAEMHDNLFSGSYIVSFYATDKYLFINTTTNIVCIDLITYSWKILSHNILDINCSTSSCSGKNYAIGTPNTVSFAGKTLYSFE